MLIVIKHRFVLIENMIDDSFEFTEMRVNINYFNVQFQIYSKYFENYINVLI